MKEFIGIIFGIRQSNVWYDRNSMNILLKSTWDVSLIANKEILKLPNCHAKGQIDSSILQRSTEIDVFIFPM